MRPMDWLRRNWPDLLIGVALVAVIAGIIATLISGGSFFPVGQGAREAGGATTPQSSTATPGVGTSPTAAAPTTNQPGTTQPGSTQPGASEPGAVEPGSAQLGTAVGTTDGTASQPAADQAATPAQPTAASPSSAPIAVLPPSGAPASTPTTSTPAAQPVTPPPSQPTASAATPAPAAAAATATAEGSSYRVSVGAFGNADNAQRLAASFQSAGYPVLLGTQGDLTIVLVGPYETEAQARTVAGRIKEGDFDVADPTVYLYEPDGSGAGAAPAAPATAAPAVTQATTPAVTQATTPASAPATTAEGDGRYLQVGAYGSRESALPQIGRLQELGFQVTERTEGSLLKILVGPYKGSALAEAQARLTSAGIESFAR